jgi:hypothetical protein
MSSEDEKSQYTSVEVDDIHAEQPPEPEEVEADAGGNDASD